jgi:hypothetical protein
MAAMGTMRTTRGFGTTHLGNTNVLDDGADTKLPRCALDQRQSADEIHLGRQRLRALPRGYFETVGVDLQVLWLHENMLEKIPALEKNTGLRRLYLQENAIHSLHNSCLPSLKFLTVLNLAKNQLQDFMETLSILRTLRHLKELDMSGNLLCEEEKYRLRVLNVLPGLDVLDKHRVTNEEREEAMKLARKSRQAQAQAHQQISRRRRSSIGVKTRRPSLEESQRHDILSLELNNIRSRYHTWRIPLRGDFEDLDPRRECALEESVFVRVLDHYDLLSSDAFVRELVLEAYSTPPPQRSKKLGRDPIYANTRFIRYPNFLKDMNQRPAALPTMARLALEIKETRRGKEMMTLHASQIMPSKDAKCASMASNKGNKVVDTRKVSIWDAVELGAALGAPGGGDLVGVSQIISVLKRIDELGWSVEGMEAGAYTILQHMDPDADGSKSKNVSLRKFVEFACEGSLALPWSPLLPEQALHKANELFARARKIIEGSSPPLAEFQSDSDPLSDSAPRLVHRALRLQAMAAAAEIK